MTDALQFTMATSAAHRNRYLFSDHYLENILPDDPRWEEALEEAGAFLAWLQDLYAHERGQLADYGEDQLRDHWFTPILERLGHVFEREAGVPGLGEGIKFPDYVFFPHEAARQRAVSAQGSEEYAEKALAVGEVKRWDRPLGKKRKGGGPSFKDRNPSWQIDYYVRATGLDWAILSNGRLWRLVHADTSHRLQIYYEVDLVQLLKEADAGRLRYFTLFFRQAALRPDAQGRVFLDDALAASNQYAVELEEDLEENVYRALERLMQGFLDLPGNALGPDDLRDIYDNSLYLLYRLLFILYGESRGLLPLDNDQYRTNYSLTRIKQRVADLEMAPAPRTATYWSRLQALFHIINGDDAELNRSLGVPRYNGGLFDPQQHPFLEEKAVGDRALVEAIDLLSRRETESGREFADYRTLGVRHLGSIYEGLLEYQPRYAREPVVVIREGGDERWVAADEAPKDAHVIERRDAGQVYLETDRGERNATGSYYTPQYIVEYIVEHAVGPLVDEAVERVRERARAAEAGQSLVDEILDLKVLDPAMGSGHFLVEATDFLALALATDPYVETGETPEEDLTHWRRRVVERCIYGVDRNPLAVELAKLSLWLATVAADRPLSFLDHHLKCGDSLIGARVEDLGWAPPPVLTKKAQEQVAQQKAGQINMYEYLLSQRLPTVMSRILEIVDQESVDYDTVRAKEAADQAVGRLKAPFRAVADLWTSAYFDDAFTAAEYGQALDLLSQPEALGELEAVQRACEVAGERRFFHWELAFPEVFYDANGQRLGDRAGFDAVVGNPPYFSVARLDKMYRQYLSKRYSEIFSGNSDILYYFLYLADRLPAKTGRFGVIVARYFQEAKYAHPLRAWLSRQLHLVRLTDFENFQVFGEDVNVLASVIILQKMQGDKQEDTLISRIVDDQTSGEEVAQALLDDSSNLFKHFRTVGPHPSGAPWQFSPKSLIEIDEKLEACSLRLSHVSNIVQSMQTGRNEILAPTTKTIQRYHIEKDVLHPLAKSGSIERYFIEELDHVLIWTEGIDLDHYPNLQAYLLPHKNDLASRYDIRNRDAEWWEMSNPRNADLFLSDIPRILVPFLATGNKFCVDYGQHLNDGGDLRALFFSKKTPYLPEYVCSLLNSRLLEFYHLRHTKLKRGGYYEYFENQLAKLPIRRIKFTTPAEAREALLKEARGHYQTYLAREEDAPLLAFVDARLEAEPEQADVVHDFLAHLAEAMIAMHEEKQARVEAFWLDLEGVSAADTYKALREHGKWERSLWRASEACRPYVDEESRSTRHLDESLGWDEAAYKVFVRELAGRVSHLSDIVDVYREHHPAYAGLVQRIAATDRLIDRIVYRLYGLTEEEIAIVEGGPSGCAGT
ncbi:MAG: TaqI-like C-terminal specificity domain-containing protein [Anaerolineae bacterium]